MHSCAELCFAVLRAEGKAAEAGASLAIVCQTGNFVSGGGSKTNFCGAATCQLSRRYRTGLSDLSSQHHQ
eukprot:1892343-Amphidinium_carterae.1